MSSSYLVLEDGTVYEGVAFGKQDPAFGEVVFSTGMYGYKAAITDSSSAGQIVVLTYPLAGNFGIDDDTFENVPVPLAGVVAGEFCDVQSAMYGGKTLAQYFEKYGITALCGVDTRDISLKIRSKGTMKGMIVKDNPEAAVKEMVGKKLLEESNMVADYSVEQVTDLCNGKEIRIGILDLGSSKRISKDLADRADITLFPYDAEAKDIIASGVKGVIVSDGPGNPNHPGIVNTVNVTVKELSEKMPVFGFGLGAAAVNSAMGGKSVKLPFGHRGCNQSVKYDDKVYITSQNHGYTVDADSLNGTGMVVEQVNINDNTVEGTSHDKLPVYTSFYYPESCPGPRDTAFLVNRFMKEVGE